MARPSEKNPPQPDHVDRLADQWARELPDLDTSPMQVLGRAWRAAMLAAPALEAHFAAYGLDRGEFDVLGTLRRSGPPYTLTPTELYRSLMISSGGLTNRLGRLEKAGLIAREPSPDDGRSLLVKLTAAGAEKAEAAFRADMALEAQLLAGLEPSDREQLAGLLRKLMITLERTGES